jgi:hypothetical protein
MTDSGSSGRGTVHAEPAPSSPSRGSRVTEPTGWVGWIWFGGTVMVLLGIFSVIEGIVALFNDKYYVVAPQGLLVFDITGWGWVHLILGALAIVAGVALFTGAMWARATAVVLLVVNAIAQLMFMPAYPFWALTVLALDIVVIWAILAHGREVRQV